MRLTSNSNTATHTKYVWARLTHQLTALILEQYPKALRIVSGGLINLKPLLTHTFPLNKAVEAFHVAADPAKGAIKVQIID